MEIRTYKAELRTASDGEAPKISGYAAVYDAYSEDMGGWYERIAPGAFTDALGTSDIRCLINHDANLIMGRCKAKTLRISEDNTGIAIECDPPDTQYSRDLQESMKRGDIDQMSFSFIPADTDWSETHNGLPVRTITKFAELYDVSVVTYPAYPTTSAQCRSAKEIFADYKPVQPPSGDAIAHRARELKLTPENLRDKLQRKPLSEIIIKYA